MTLLTLLTLLTVETPFYLIGEPVCEPQGVDPNAVTISVPAGAVQGLILPADPNRPDRWRFPAGPWTREGSCCDPEGDPFTIRLLSGPADATVTLAGERWRLAGTLGEGLNLFVVEATDVRLYGDAASSLWTLPVWGEKPNRPPVLH